MNLIFILNQFYLIVYKLQQVMKRKLSESDIETSLKRINRKFADEILGEQRQTAIQQFMKVYQQEMSKLASQVSHKKKIQDNLTNIVEEEKRQVQMINHELIKKMQIHQKKRELQNENKRKKNKLMQQNWKLRFDEMVRKSKQKKRQLQKQAQLMRREAESFWIEKSNISSRKQEQKQISSVKISRIQSHVQNKAKRTLQLISKAKGSETVLDKTLLPNLQKSSFLTIPSRQNKIKRNKASETLSIISHQQKSLKEKLEKEEQNFQTVMEKLDKIQKRRSQVQKRIQKQVNEAKRVRQQRESPEYRAQLRRKSFQNIKSKSRIKKQKIMDPQQSHFKQEINKLNTSVSKALQNKKKISLLEFKEREQVYKASIKRLNRQKLNRLVREAVFLLKNEIRQILD